MYGEITRFKFLSSGSSLSSPSTSGATSADLGMFFLGAGVGVVPKKNVLVLGTLRGCALKGRGCSGKVGGGGRAGFSLAGAGCSTAPSAGWEPGGTDTTSLVVDSAVVCLASLGSCGGRGGLYFRTVKGLPRRWGPSTGDPGGGAGGCRRVAFTSESGFLGTAGFSPLTLLPLSATSSLLFSSAVAGVLVGPSVGLPSSAVPGSRSFGRGGEYEGFKTPALFFSAIVSSGAD